VRVIIGERGQRSEPGAVDVRFVSVPAIRDQKAAESRAAEIAAAEARGREAALSSLEVPGAHQTRSVRPSPVLSQAGEGGNFKPRTSVLQRPQPETGTMAAVAAFRSGKYRQKSA
jgi:hypothetical protein